MSSISDTQLMRAGLLSDMMLGFRSAMRGRALRDAAHADMPDHLRDERNLPRRREFLHGVRIGMTWRQMRTGAATARREDRNRQFREEGMAYCIDPAQVRQEAHVLLLDAIAQAEFFGRPNIGLVQELSDAIDHDRSRWDVGSAVLYYGSEGASGVLSPMARTSLRAMGERGWTSMEAVYQAQKFLYDIALQDAVRLAPDGHAAKAVAREHRSARRRDWHARRVTAMVRATILRIEQDAAYRLFLLTQQGRDIVEDTTHGEIDRFWGVAEGLGTNVAGQIAMLARDRAAAGDCRLKLD